MPMTLHCIITAILLPAICALAQEYKLGNDSERHAGVPQGQVLKYTWTSKVYPGTTRDYWVYVPAQYKSDKPAAVMVFQDGGSFVTENGAWRVPVVFDNLIRSGEMPVTVGIFINPGVLPALVPGGQARVDRSDEYDTITDRYSRFLTEEILPEVAKSYNLSTDPNDRAIAGSSSGGICAFTVAWQRPDTFHRVLSFIGSYTNLRGGEIYPSLIRVTEPKPIRIFLQDGNKDLNIYAGNWFIAAQDMLSAFEYAGYDITHVWGTEGHNSKQGGSILPDALRWLWRGYPSRIEKPKGGGGERQWSVLLTDPQKSWEPTSAGHGLTQGLAASKTGEVFFSDVAEGRIYKIDLAGTTSVFKADSGGSKGLQFGPDGRLYACQAGRKRIVAYAMDGTESIIAQDVNSQNLAITIRGEIYFTDPLHKRVWFIDAKGSKRIAYEGIAFPNGICLSTDQAFLTVDDSANRGVWSFQIQPDGSLANGSSFYRLEMEDDSSITDAGGMALDTDGWLYVATKTGVQVFDAPARIVAIIERPLLSSVRVTNIAFGGPNRDMLYVSAGGSVFKRPIKRKGAASWESVKAAVPPS